MDPSINTIEPRSRLVRVLGLLAGLLAFCALIGAGTAAAATQHWASSQPAPYGKSQAFTGKSVGLTMLTWKYGGGTIEIECGGSSASGSVENPSSGAAGKFSSTGLALTKCKLVGMSKCKIQNEAITFESLSAVVYAEAGKQYVEFKPASGSKLASVYIENAPSQSGCALASLTSYPLTGSFSVYANAEPNNDVFVLSSTVSGTHMNLAGYALAGNGEYEFLTTSEIPLLLGAEATPHWYLTGWKDLANGKPQSVSSGESLSFNFAGKPFGVKAEFACSGSGDKLEGLIENESPSGAAKGSATLALAHCVLVGEELGSRCSVEVGTVPLSAVSLATPAIMLSPVEGKQLMSVVVKQTPGAKSCGIVGTFKVTGKLVATSLEGRFAISGSKAESEFELGGTSATATGSMRLENSLGEFLRLQEL